MNDTEPFCELPKSASVTDAEIPDADRDDIEHQDHQAGSPENGSNDIGRSSDTVERPREIGGRKGPDPVRYGDWEKNGRCIDF